MLQTCAIRCYFDQSYVIMADGHIVFLDLSESCFMLVPDIVVLVSYICVKVHTTTVDLVGMSSYVPSAQFQELNSCE